MILALYDYKTKELIGKKPIDIVYDSPQEVARIILSEICQENSSNYWTQSVNRTYFECNCPIPANNATFHCGLVRDRTVTRTSPFGIERAFYIIYEPHRNIRG